MLERFQSVVITSGTLSPLDMYPKVRFSHTGFRIHIHLLRIPIQHFFYLRLRIQIWIQFRIQDLMTKKGEKFTAEKFFFFSNCNLLIPKGRTSYTEKSSALKREHPALKNMNEISLPYFLFLFLWVILPSCIRFQHLKLMRIGIRIRNRGPINLYLFPDPVFAKSESVS